MIDCLCHAMLDRLDQCELRSEPWEHVEQLDFLDRDAADLLAQSFDDIALDRHESSDGEKPYRLSNHLLPARFEQPDRPWQHLANFLQGPDYRSALERLTGRRLDGRVTLNMWAYHPGDWLGPHLDKPGKQISQVLYLTPGWTPADGGRLAMLAGEAMSSVIRYVPPLYGGIFVFTRCERSWHAVEPVSPGGAVRRSMTLNYWSDA
jgi:Rps23 Pro-64 3,4-dihydroxylase Tpa1-like proline 4-hydroxylase